MGRTRLDLEVPVLDGGGHGDVSTLRVQWRILFDWTGEARSEIGVLVGVPGKCEYFWLLVQTSNFRLLTWWQGINMTSGDNFLVYRNYLMS
jgi:hypothetical protein